MANDVTANPLIFDTANTTTVVDARHLDVMGVRWVGGTTAGHQAILKNANGKVLYSLVATGANYSEESQARVRADGLIMHTLASGILYVYLKVS